MNKQLQIFTNGFLKENPLLVLNIGLCSSLGVTTSIFNGLGMGMSMTFVLLMSEFVISIFRKCIPNAIRLPVFIIIIAAFTTIVQFVLQAYVESLYDALGVFLPLIVVNCIIMGRVESFASKNNVGNSILDALGMGIGYTCVLVVISLVREFFGGGTLMAGTIDQSEALEKGMAPLREFMYPQTQVKDVELFMDIAGLEWDGTLEDIPNSVLVPSFMISELRTAFWIGFMIYIPFIVIDMVVASTLMSMGMMMLPPTTISMPFKILLFVLADGWALIIGQLVQTFY